MFRRLLLTLLLAPLSSFAASFDANLSWTDNSANEDGFNIYRDGAKIGAVGPNVTTYTDTGLAESTQYCYQIGAYNSAGEAKGAQTCGTTGVVVVPPAAPGSPTIIYIGKP